jgi:hypothetical protein
MNRKRRKGVEEGGGGREGRSAGRFDVLQIRHDIRHGKCLEYMQVPSIGPLGPLNSVHFSIKHSDSL